MSDQTERPKKGHDIVLLRKALGMALVSLRERRGLQQQQVAEEMETTRGHLSGMETGRGDPKLSMMWRLSAVLKISPVALMREILKNFHQLKKDSD